MHGGGPGGSDGSGGDSVTSTFYVGVPTTDLNLPAFLIPPKGEVHGSNTIRSRSLLFGSAAVIPEDWMLYNPIHIVPSHVHLFHGMRS